MSEICGTEALNSFWKIGMRSPKVLEIPSIINIQTKAAKTTTHPQPPSGGTT